jgi:hypothetical protein
VRDRPSRPAEPNGDHASRPRPCGSLELLALRVQRVVKGRFLAVAGVGITRCLRLTMQPRGTTGHPHAAQLPPWRLATKPFYLVSGRSVISHEHPQWALVIGRRRDMCKVHRLRFRVRGQPAWPIHSARMTRAATSLLGEEEEATVRAAYPGLTWDRLRELKRRDDPDNLFRLNHNISPADG